MDVLSQFGIDPVKFLAQLAIGLAIIVAPAIYATIVIAKPCRSNGAILLWLGLIWFFPVVGPISAILAARGGDARQ
jgi:hypothetical protein